MNDVIVQRPRPQLQMSPAVTRFRLLTSSLRVLPDFLILGGMRCGTSSLYSYLSEHPQIVLPWTKETHYIGRVYWRGIRWYRANFPTWPAMLWHRIMNSGTALTFEATPDYLVYPAAARRLSMIVPNAKFIVLLRNPADRAYSHYQFNLRLERERHPFAKAIQREAKRLEGEREKILSDESYRARKHRRYSYTLRGMYVDQLREYERFFRRDQFLILKSEDLFEKTQETYDQVLRFLSLAPWRLQSTGSANAGSYSREKLAGYDELCEFFAPHNQRLYEYLGRDLSW